MDWPLKEKNQLLIDAIRDSGMTVAQVAEKAQIGFTHLVRLNNDKRIEPRRTTIKMLERVLGSRVREAFKVKLTDKSYCKPPKKPSMVKREDINLMLCLRKYLKMTQKELSTISGLSTQAITRVEAGGKTRKSTAEKLSKAMGVIPEFFTCHRNQQETMSESLAAKNTGIERQTKTTERG